MLAAARLIREALTGVARRSRGAVDPGFPGPLDLAPSRHWAEELWRRLERLPAEVQRAVVAAAVEYQTWALCERVCEAAVREASRNLERAAGLARLAQAIAERVRGPAGWRNRVRGYAGEHVANLLRVGGELKDAEASLQEAERLWNAGSDPTGVLDSERLIHFKAALRRDQRRFDEALALLNEAAKGRRYPGRALINKGFTLEVMGEYEQAIEALLQAAPLVDRETEPRLRYILRFNLAVNYCQIGNFAEAANLLQEVREFASALGDGLNLIRVTWLEGRIAAGLGRPEEARRLLGEARHKFAARRMLADAALALLEEAALLLDADRTVEVKILAQDLAQVLESKGVHREALAALRLFQEAAEQETATAELARRVLQELYRARHGQGLRFSVS